MTGAIYQLNKYNKAWLLFTVEFQELLVIFWKTYRLNSREFFTFTCIHTLRLQKRGLLYETGFLPGFKFFTSLLSWFSCVLCVLLFSFGTIHCERKNLDFEGQTWNRGKCGNMHTYIHAYIHAMHTYMHTYIGTYTYVHTSHTYTHTYIHTTHTHTYLHPKIWNLRLLASSTGNPSWSRTLPELVCCEATN